MERRIPGSMLYSRQRIIASGLANGKRVILKDMMQKCLNVTIATGPKAVEDVYHPMISLTPSDSDLPFFFHPPFISCKAFICYAMTINKSQGQTLLTDGMERGTGLYCQISYTSRFHISIAWISKNPASLTDNSTLHVREYPQKGICIYILKLLKRKI